MVLVKSFDVETKFTQPKQGIATHHYREAQLQPQNAPT